MHTHIRIDSYCSIYFINSYASIDKMMATLRENKYLSVSRFTQLGMFSGRVGNLCSFLIVLQEQYQARYAYLSTISFGVLFPWHLSRLPKNDTVIIHRQICLRTMRLVQSTCSWYVCWCFKVAELVQWIVIYSYLLSAFYMFLQ